MVSKNIVTPPKVKKRRLFKEYDDVSSIDQASQNATIHGVVAAVSPQMLTSKSGKNYFDGSLTDGKKKIRLVGFDEEKRARLAAFRTKKEAVALQNCQVKPSRDSTEFEVFVKGCTELLQSPKKTFDVAGLDLAAIDTKEITLNQLAELPDFQRVTVAVKAVRVDQPVHVVGGKRKQEIMLSDSSGKSKLTLWEGDIGKLPDGESYRLRNMSVRSYNGRKYLAMPREDATIETVSNIGEVEEDDGELQEEESQQLILRNAQVISVATLETYYRCMSCGSGRVSANEGSLSNIGYCSKCPAAQLLSPSRGEQWAAKLIVAEGSTGTTVTLHAYGEIVKEIAEQDVSTESLLTSSPFTVYYGRSNVIAKVYRIQKCRGNVLLYPQSCTCVIDRHLNLLSSLILKYDHL